jgi:uncharacterized membrane protein (UPF0127 family)
MVFLGGGCDPTDSMGGAVERNDLASMRTDKIAAEGHTFQVWLAETAEQHRLGLMNVTQDELPDDWGMLFVFSDDRVRYFWMRNTLIPLDIAYIDRHGRVVKTHTMPPLTLQNFSSEQPARYALEINAGLCTELGIDEGDTVMLPDSVLRSP